MSQFHDSEQLSMFNLEALSSARGMKSMLHTLPRPQSASCRFEVEPDWNSFFKEVTPLMRQHYRELSHEDFLYWEPDHDLFRALAAAGRLVIVVARDGLDHIIGYHMFLVCRHPHYKLTTAYEDTVYLAPACRKGWTGYRLFRESVRVLRERGVQRIFLHEKVYAPLDAIYRRLGAEPSDHLWLLKLGG